MAIGASAVINSTAGVLIRQVEAASEWQIIAYRGIGVVIGLSVIFCLQERGRVLLAFRQITLWLLLHI